MVRKASIQKRRNFECSSFTVQLWHSRCTNRSLIYIYAQFRLDRKPQHPPASGTRCRPVFEGRNSENDEIIRVCSSESSSGPATTTGCCGQVSRTQYAMNFMNSAMYNWLCELIFFDKEDIHKRGTICKNVHIAKNEFKRSS